MSIECTTIYFVGLDVHKESVTAAVFRGREAEPMRVDRLNNDDRSLRATSSDWPRPARRGRATRRRVQATCCSARSRSGATPASWRHRR